VADYYAARLADHGPTAAGVDWNSRESQELRFEQLLRVMDRDAAGSLNDYGCGYGALLEFIQGRGLQLDYFGYDIAEQMVAVAQERATDAAARFTTVAAELPVADYTVASGIFNVRLEADDAAWLEHVVATLAHMQAISSRGFAFNMLTSYSDPERMRTDLYYADPGFILDHCVRNLSRRVAILHDYELYEFTVLVRLGPS
jgi:SAM-dependent methyltransferase